MDNQLCSKLLILNQQEILRNRKHIHLLRLDQPSLCISPIKNSKK